jgi:predicted nucleic acid-binding protein
MVLVDTSVWIAHFKKGNRRLVELLSNGEVACHPFIIGELACGRLKNRAEILSLMQALSTVPMAEHEEILRFIEAHDLTGMGIGLVDVHLLASALLTGIPLWTYDRKLKTTAKKFGISYS